MKKILVPVDGSNLSLRIVDVAIDVAKAKESEVTLLYVIPLHKYVAGQSMDILEQSHAMKHAMDIVHEESRKNAIKMLESLAQKFIDNNIKVEKCIKSGEPYEEILKIAESEDYGLIVMGNRGFSVTKKLFLGSVSQHVLNNSRCPVLIVKER